MKFKNIVKRLRKEGYKVEVMEFSFQNVLGVRGTALIDLVNENVIETTAKYNDVVKQVEANKSHIQTITTVNGCNRKILTDYLKL